MTGSAMPISRCARGLALASLVAATPLAARADETVRDRAPGVEDIAMTPLTDLNLARDPIPELLLAAYAAPYASDGLDDCGELGGEIARLDAVLGPDFDVADEQREQVSLGRIAKSAVGSFIPFRSILREVTGVADHERDFEAAIVAGLIRRGYLKGLGEQKGCSYPARPAFAKIDVAPDTPVEWDEGNPRLALRSPAPAPAPLPAPQIAKDEGDPQITFVSQEVVQGAME